MARELVATPTADDYRLRMSYEEYLDWMDEGTRAEWVDGEVVVFMPITRVHQMLVSFLDRLLGTFSELFGLGDVLLGPAQMRLVVQRSAREPDVFFLAAAHRDRRTRLGIEGPADLVIEIVSDDSVRRDQVDKRDEYAAAGVPEYWWLDSRPGHQSARFYRRAEDGRFVEVGLDEAGRFHSAALPSFWLDPSWLWQDPLPNPLALLGMIAPDALRTFVRTLDTDPDPTGGAR